MELCGERMPRAREACARGIGHGGKHRSAASVARRRKYDRGREVGIRGRARQLLRNARGRSGRKGLPCDLTLEWVEVALVTALNEGCPYLGIPITLNGDQNDPHSPSIDQFRPGVGYMQANCIIVSFKANTMKNDAPPEFTERLGRNVGHLARTRFRRVA